MAGSGFLEPPDWPSGEAARAGQYRVVEVWCASRGTFGSGYAIGDDLALTADHVLPAEQQCVVRPLGYAGWLAAEVIWRGHDVALLRVPAAPWREGSDRGAVRWGRVRGVEAVPCTATGFPWTQERPDGMRDSEAIRGELVPGTTAKSGRYAVHVASGMPASIPDGSPWRGMSGAALLSIAGRHLLGIITANPDRFEPSRLSAVPVVALFADTGFAAHVPVDLGTVDELPPHPFLQPAYQPLPLGPPAAWLVQPRFGVVPYIGREDLLSQLEEWCAGYDAHFSIAVVTGEGGSGKSRLAAELCTRLWQRGWDAGFASAVRLPTAWVAQSATLIVVDYPERWTGTLGEMLSWLARRTSGPRTRVLLLARERGRHSHWWRKLDGESQQIPSLLTHLELDLGDHALRPGVRQQHAQEAFSAFAKRLPTIDAAPPNVTADVFASPLLTHIAALLAAYGESIDQADSGGLRQQLLAHLLIRERTRWEQLAESHKLADLHPTHGERAVVLALLTSPAPAEAAQLLATLPELSGPEQRERRSKIALWLADLYPGPALLASFGPDLLIEELIADAATRWDLGELAAAACANPASDTTHISRMLDVFVLAATRREPRAVLRQVLARHLRKLVTTALDEPDPKLLTSLDNALAAAACIDGESGEDLIDLAITATRVLAEGPWHSIRGARLLGTVTRLTVWALRCLVAIDPDSCHSLAFGLHLLANYHSQAGRPQDALVATAEVVNLRRQLADVEPDSHLAHLAFELLNLASVHAELDQNRQAILAAEEAVGHYRRLASCDPERYRADFGIALDRLATNYAEGYRLPEALAASAEAVTLVRPYADGDISLLAYLARCLHHQGIVLARVGRTPEGIQALEEAVVIFRPLADAEPDQHLPSLAWGLTDLTSEYVTTGLINEALAAGQEAVDRSRLLATTNPDRHHLYLAVALTNLGKAHLEAGDLHTAIRTLQEAVEVNQTIVDHQPGQRSILPDSLQFLADAYSLAGQSADALTASQRAVDFCRSRPLEDHERLERRLSDTLLNHSTLCHRLGRDSEAATAASEATAMLRFLSDVENAHLPALANALTHLSRAYVGLDQPAEARVAAREAVELGRRLIVSGHAAYGVSDLARDIGALTDAYTQSGWMVDAVKAAEEAVQLGRELGHHNHQRNRQQFALDLAKLARLRGRRSDLSLALRTAEEAVRVAEELTASSMTRYGLDLAFALGVLSDIYLGLIHNAEALDAAKRATVICEQLARCNPKHLGRFAESVDRLCHRSVVAGDDDGALDAAHAQVAAYQQLVNLNPALRPLLMRSQSLLIRLVKRTGRTGTGPPTWLVNK